MGLMAARGWARGLARSYWASRVSARIRPSVACRKNASHCCLMRSTLATCAAVDAASAADDVEERLAVDARRLRRGRHARAVNRDDVVDQHVAARAVEGHAGLRRGVLRLLLRHVDRALHVEEGRNLRRRHQAHRVLIEQAVAADGAGGAERAAAEILDVVAFHDRRVRVHEEAPVGDDRARAALRTAARCGR